MEYSPEQMERKASYIQDTGRGVYAYMLFVDRVEIYKLGIDNIYRQDFVTDNENIMKEVKRRSKR